MNVCTPLLALGFPGLLGQASPGGMQSLVQMAPLVIMFVIFYFLLIRPQQKKQRELQEWLKSLKKGDDVVTTGGILGKIHQLSDQVVTLELQDKIRLRVLRSHIAGKAPAQGQPAPEPKQ